MAMWSVFEVKAKVAWPERHVVGCCRVKASRTKRVGREVCPLTAECRKGCQRKEGVVVLASWMVVPCSGRGSVVVIPSRLQGKERGIEEKMTKAGSELQGSNKEDQAPCTGRKPHCSLAAQKAHRGPTLLVKTACTPSTPVAFSHVKTCWLGPFNPQHSRLPACVLTVTASL